MIKGKWLGIGAAVNVIMALSDRRNDSECSHGARGGSEGFLCLINPGGFLSYGEFDKSCPYEQKLAQTLKWMLFSAVVCQP